MKKLELTNYRINITERLYKMFEDLKKIYPCNTVFIKDRYNQMLVDISKKRSINAMNEIFIQNVKYISQIETQIAIHNLKKEGIL